MNGRIYGETICSWKIQRVIEVKRLYNNPAKTDRIQAKRARTLAKVAKKKTIDLIKGLPAYKKTSGYIICLDTIVIYWNGIKRYILSITSTDRIWGCRRMPKIVTARSETTKQSHNFRLNTGIASLLLVARNDTMPFGDSPHMSLNYQAPLKFSKVLPMYSSCTQH